MQYFLFVCIPLFLLIKMLFAIGDDLSYGLNTLGPLCLWQCFFCKSIHYVFIFKKSQRTLESRKIYLIIQLPFFLPRPPGPQQQGGVSCTWGTSSYSSTEAIFMPHMFTYQASHIAACMIEIQTDAAFVFCKRLLQGFDLHF